jgi:hypothetical protein
MEEKEVGGRQRRRRGEREREMVAGKKILGEVLVLMHARQALDPPLNSIPTPPVGFK